MGEIHKSYYAIIPANVRYDTELTPNAKLLYGEITALSNERGYCWASNDYFAELYDVTTRQVKRWVKSLIDRGYIDSSLTYKEGTKEVDKRYLRIAYNNDKKDTTSGQKRHEGSDKKDTYNNTVINNTSNNTNEYKEHIEEIVSYLNHTCGTSYRAASKDTQKLIIARIKEGYSVEDFKTVIIKKNREWSQNKDMVKYLRPNTLFGNKFESYLNQIEVPRTTIEGHVVSDEGEIPF